MKLCISVTHVIVCVIGQMCVCVQAVRLWPCVTQ